MLAEGQLCSLFLLKNCRNNRTVGSFGASYLPGFIIRRALFLNKYVSKSICSSLIKEVITFDLYSTYG